MHRNLRTRPPIAAGLMLAALAACDRPDRIVAPLDAKSVAAATASASAPNVGCAVITDDPSGGLRRAIIKREAVPFAVPKQETAQRDSSGRAVLHVLAFNATRNVAGTPRSVAVACIVPATYTNDAFAYAVQHAGPAAWARV